MVYGLRKYIRHMAERVPGMKALVVDAHTAAVVSMLLSMSDLERLDIFLLLLVDTEVRESMRHMKAVYFVQPTGANREHIIRVLREPKFSEYHLFFSNLLPEHHCRKLAVCDDFEVVQAVHELFADVFAVNHDLFSLNMGTTAHLAKESRLWDSEEESTVERIVEGLFSVCMALRMSPVIRFTASSEVTKRVAQRLKHHIDEQRANQEHSIFDDFERECGGQGSHVMMLMDRRSDPVTPLLTQWTYQGMLHDMLTLDQNRVDMSRVPGNPPELRLAEMCTTQDRFYGENAFSNFPDLCQNVQRYSAEVEQLEEAAKRRGLDEMAQFAERYAEIQSKKPNLAKHLAIADVMRGVIEERGLYDASELEQAIACEESHADHYQRLLELLAGPRIGDEERLRLVLLYALRYEQNAAYAESVEKLKGLLRERFSAEERQRIGLVEAVLKYAGSKGAHDKDLFLNKSWCSTVKRTLKDQKGAADSIYTMHKSEVGLQCQKLLEGKLKELRYPFLEPRPQQQDAVMLAVVFVIGGTTYEEARDVDALNRSWEGGRSVVLGGTTVHNSRSFLEEVERFSAAQQASCQPGGSQGG